MELGVFSAWSAATLLVPIALPFVSLFFVKLGFETRRDAKLYRTAVADGQLFWLTVSLAASAVFDASQSIEKAKSIGILSVVWFCVLVSIAVFFIALWTVGSLNGVKHVPASSKDASSASSTAEDLGGMSTSGIAMKEDALISASRLCLGITAVSYALFKWLV